MSKEKTSVEEVLKRVNELLDVLKVLSEDLTEISKTLKATVAVPASAAASRKAPSPEKASAPSQMRTVEDVQKVFPSDLAGMLYFEVTEENVLIKPRQFLGSDAFAKIAAIVRDQLGGEYVRQGRESHFKVPRRT